MRFAIVIAAIAGLAMVVAATVPAPLLGKNDVSSHVLRSRLS